MEYLHPSVSTRIIDNSIMFMAAQGLTNLYAVITSDKGADNVIKYMTSPTEYLFEYGTPNFAKHGQVPLNVYEWLNTSGGAYVLRVVPPDARYANSVIEARYKNGATRTAGQLNIKTSVTQVLDERQTLADGSVNANYGKPYALTKDMVASYLADATPTTFDSAGVAHSGIDADGFTVKRIAAIIPKARGLHYNNLGYRFTTTDAYDSTYAFRVFNFEVIEQVAGGGYSVVEGPFLVSFAPDAMNRGQESMYLPAVLSKYSSYFDAFVNDKALDDLAAVIDVVNEVLYPNIFGPVNPDLIDVVSGSFPNKVDGVNFVAATRCSVTLEGSVVPGDVVEIGLIASNNSNVQTIAVTAASGDTLSTLVSKLELAADPMVDFNAFVIPADPTVLFIQNADARESFEVVSVAVTRVSGSTLGATYTQAARLVNFLSPVSPEVNVIAPAAVPQFSEYANLADINFLKGGYSGTLYDAANADVNLGKYTRDMLLSRGYGKGGYIDPRCTNKKEIVIDMVMDGNYSDTVKDAIVNFCSSVRGDCFAVIDTGFTANPQQALDWRKNNPFSTFYAGIFTQDMVIDEAFSGQEAKVTSTYFLASKIPTIDEQFGIHFPFVGPRRGTISGFKRLSWNPTEPEKELLYKRQINYVESDVKRTKFGSQLTSQTIVSALSNINAVRTLLRIKRDVETMAEDYQFEFGDAQTYNAFQYNLNGYLQRWIANRACSSIKGQVYASAYDKQQKIARVRIDLTFNYVIERIFIDIVVNK